MILNIEFISIRIRLGIILNNMRNVQGHTKHVPD